ncbi:Uncharacterised protein [Escherichia coli]|nr:hypothetical protein BvCmsH52A_01758 [Escherichia coli]GCV48692.1 hypothetical protein HmCmsJML046_00289 [Escherichia coli]SQL04318.1 Uncharacterised protein [Escherichia coli]
MYKYVLLKRSMKAFFVGLSGKINSSIKPCFSVPFRQPQKDTFRTITHVHQESFSF